MGWAPRNKRGVWGCCRSAPAAVALLNLLRVEHVNHPRSIVLGLCEHVRRVEQALVDLRRSLVTLSSDWATIGRREFLYRTANPGNTTG